MENRALSAKQKKLLRLLENPGSCGGGGDGKDREDSPEALCRAAGVDPADFYSWLRLPPFRMAMEHRLEGYIHGELGRVWRILMDLVEQGNIQAIKLYFDLRSRVERQAEDPQKLEELVKAVMEVE